MTQSPTGGPAQTTYQVASRAGVVGHDAQRVVIVTDGRPAEGGPQQAVYFVSDAEIAAGDFIVTGNKPLPIVQVGAVGVEYPPIAVYNVTGMPDDVQPSQNPPTPPVPVPPLFSSAEVGNVNASTVAVTFDQNVTAPGNDYSSGVTIKVNGVVRAFESGIRQADHAVVYYALSTPAEAGDTVTWEYSAAAGGIVAEDDGAALDDVTAQSVTNNVAPAAVLPQVASATLLLDLRASQLALSDGDPVSTWPDASGLGHDFTQTGSARPTYRSGSGTPYVEFDGSSTYLDGGNFADNLDTFAVFCVAKSTLAAIGNGIMVCKTSADGTPQGWALDAWGSIFYAQLSDGNSYMIAGDYNAFYYDGQKRIFCGEAISRSLCKLFVDSSEITAANSQGNTPFNYSNSSPVFIAHALSGNVFSDALIYSILIYQITNLAAWDATDRAAIEAWLATNP